MNILIVDDFKPIVETIAENIEWKSLGFDKVYQATSAKEAKLLLSNFEIEVMLCDIEMPEENGLQLLTWARAHLPEIECVFLTSHAEFDYAVEAMKLGSFDYILQPAKFEDIYIVLERLTQKVREKQRYQTLKAVTLNAADHRDNILEIMKVKIDQGKDEEADKVCEKHLQVYAPLYDSRKCNVRQILVKVEKWKHFLQKKDPEEIKKIYKRTLSSLLDETRMRIALSSQTEHLTWIMLFLDASYLTDELWIQKITEFQNFICDNLDVTVSIYSMREASSDHFSGVLKKLLAESGKDTYMSEGIHIAENEVISKSSSLHPSISAAIDYIRKNLNKNISRADVASSVGVSDEYFSRLFKKETGENYKDYITSLKMDEAKKLLDETNLSIGIIASKVGYVNFSHFSQVFRDYTGYTPLDYKKRAR